MMTWLLRRNTVQVLRGDKITTMMMSMSIVDADDNDVDDEDDDNEECSNAPYQRTSSVFSCRRDIKVSVGDSSWVQNSAVRSAGERSHAVIAGKNSAVISSDFFNDPLVVVIVLIFFSFYFFTFVLRGKESVLLVIAISFGIV